ncbi:hypothetical protein [Paenibacillus sp. 7516]|uniref:hypothetical protein n=1 Tax=Paenibacillus sp. 7516 TaxID=2022549 RepID=UPI000BA6BA0E|nr:hypothetical protein [Paenibacillus sp. 7516]PAF32086.1 hypothetical protein CHI14_10650 [Paenibacillus sp. 7516]
MLCSVIAFNSGLAADQYGKLKMVLQVAAIIAILLGNYPFHLLTDIRVDMADCGWQQALHSYPG